MKIAADKYFASVPFPEVERIVAKKMLQTYMQYIPAEQRISIFEVIDKDREDLRIWLPFVDSLKSAVDEERFLQSVLAGPYEQRDPVYILEQGETICGLAGFHFSDAPNHRTEIGYWLLPTYRGKGIITHAVRYLCQWAVCKRNINRIQIR